MECRRCERSLTLLGLRCPVCRTKRLLWYVLMAVFTAAFTLLIILIAEFVTR